ncbi:AzlD domain-containing protein [Pseudomonadota bacterium]
MVIFLAALATYASRGLGALLSGRVRPDGPVVEWIICITYALMAGLIVRMILLPIGGLEATPDWTRIVATLVGVAAFWIGRKSIAWGVTAGSLTLAILIW